MPNETLYHLRWDPPPVTHGPITIQKIEILDSSHSLVKRLSLHQLAPLHQIQALDLSDEKADIRVQEGANDPQVDIRLESPILVKKLYVLAKFLGGVLLEFTGFFLGACLLIYIWFRWKDKISVWFHQRNKIIATVIVIYCHVLRLALLGIVR